MPDFNPFAPTVEVGGTATATAGPAAATAGGRFAVGNIANGAGADNHWAAAIILGALILLWALYQSKFRFSMTVG